MSTILSNYLTFQSFKGYSRHQWYNTFAVTGSFREHAVFTLLTLGCRFVHPLLCILESKLMCLAAGKSVCV